MHCMFAYVHTRALTRVHSAHAFSQMCICMTGTHMSPKCSCSLTDMHTHAHAHTHMLARAVESSRCCRSGLRHPVSSAGSIANSSRGDTAEGGRAGGRAHRTPLGSELAQKGTRHAGA